MIARLVVYITPKRTLDAKETTLFRSVGWLITIDVHWKVTGDLDIFLLICPEIYLDTSEPGPARLEKVCNHATWLREIFIGWREILNTMEVKFSFRYKN